ncbi:pentapeptide repeat-containing protein [Saccharothrix sp. S26]|uniref:pentapeptide repeat-containing protein n=1 Tax=Saccharothrix sp. S26 TaxID=2907215 RepID=UPI001F3BE017|nr:pentapeptide repeat-containing protein [Saccharothrix sp. S26]MCE6999794.1 pentapeptide repeat-containing protein [Saccharothrix sp. S26]
MDHRVLSARTIVFWAVGLGVVAVGSVAVLLVTLGSGEPQDGVRLDVVRTASSIVLGTGGAAALLLTARRQRCAELDLVQKDHDATERRVTELYGKAADQLGSDKAPVRLAGLYALERLAQGNPAHRQTIVHLVCAYLRMPFTPPPEARARTRLGPRDAHRFQELEVRQTATALLAAHLRPDRPEAFWADIALDLSHATLVKLTLTHARIRAASFAGTTFVGPATFRGTEFAGTADFRDTCFRDLADFRRVSFGDSVFRGAEFEGGADFGVHTAAKLAGARARTRDLRRKWPQGWVEQAAEPDWAVLATARRTP